MNYTAGQFSKRPLRPALASLSSPDFDASMFVFHNKHQRDNYEKESRAICKTPSGFSLFPARIHEIVLPRPGAVIREQQGAGRLPQFIFLWLSLLGLYRMDFLTQRSKGHSDNPDVHHLAWRSRALHPIRSTNTPMSRRSEKIISN